MNLTSGPQTAIYYIQTTMETEGASFGRLP